MERSRSSSDASPATDICGFRLGTPHVKRERCVLSPLRLRPFEQKQSAQGTPNPMAHSVLCSVSAGRNKQETSLVKAQATYTYIPATIKSKEIGVMESLCGCAVLLSAALLLVIGFYYLSLW